MAGKFLSMEEAASALGLSVESLSEMRQQQKVYGYRDGQSWKFKPEEIERFREEIGASAADAADASSEAFDFGDSTELGDAIDFGPAADIGDSTELGEVSEMDDSAELAELPIDLDFDSGDDVVLLSEVELGESGSTSSTVIGKPGQGLPPEDSDIKLISGGGETEGGDAAGASDVQLVGDSQELSLEPSSSIDFSSAPESPASSDVDLSSMDDDDDLVLQSPGGSDITLSAGDSGISLVDPADSGLSLEDPLDLGDGGESSFDLGDDIQVVEQEAVATESDDDFLLTPSADRAEEVADDSGSQIIDLDSDSAAFEEVGASFEDSSAMVEMLDDDESDAFPGAAPMGASASAPAATTKTAAAPVGAEAAYSLWNVLSLGGCTVLLMFTGMMMFDLMRNMWSWNGPVSLNSAMMDAIIGIFEG